MFLGSVDFVLVMHAADPSLMADMEVQGQEEREAVWEVVVAVGFEAHQMGSIMHAGRFLVELQHCIVVAAAAAVADHSAGSLPEIRLRRVPLQRFHQN